MSVSAPANLSYPAAVQPAASAASMVTRVLTLTYGLVPIVAGLDKFTNLLTNWEAMLPPSLGALLPFSGHAFMMLVGLIEIAAGVLTLLRPRLGAWVVMAWLVAIGLTLLTTATHFDVAVRDFVMAVGAWALARLSARPEPQA